MRVISMRQLEKEIVQEIRKWRDEILADPDGLTLISEIDAADARRLAADITVSVIAAGVQIEDWPNAEVHCLLSEGWELRRSVKQLPSG